MAAGDQRIVCSGSSILGLGLQKRGAGTHDAQVGGELADHCPSSLPAPAAWWKVALEGQIVTPPHPHGQHGQDTRACVDRAGDFSRKGHGEQRCQPGTSLAPAVRTLEKLTTSVIIEVGGGRPHSVSDFIFLSAEEGPLGEGGDI